RHRPALRDGLTPATLPRPVSDRVQLLSYPAERPRGTVLFAHGLYESQREIYGFLFSGLRRHGYSVELYTLPYHYERKPAESLFSGEYFFSADLVRTRLAFLQAADELRGCLRSLRRDRGHPVYLGGFSMGGAIALLVAASLQALEGACAINPPANFPALIWTSPLCSTIRADLERAGADQGDVATWLRDIDPLHVRGEGGDRGRVLMVQALYDLVTAQDQYDELASAWQFQHRAVYPAGHLNTLRVPRLADDVARFFDGLSGVAGAPPDEA
ncbi:MAG TPA: alpha/beta fold hydrolase, partial [Anaeromyxobacter sp.]|nr:alpha/beta fold hydrolase [Anaeromyxobacter sp.]